jgi:hypothetical protein
VPGLPGRTLLFRSLTNPSDYRTEMYHLCHTPYLVVHNKIKRGAEDADKYRIGQQVFYLPGTGAFLPRVHCN